MNIDAISAHARQFKRHSAQLQARAEPHADHAEQFRLSFPDSFSEMAVTDVSQGGLGFVSSVMFPKNLRLMVHVDIKNQGGDRTFLVRGIVRRCAMIDHKPTYQIGVQFMEPKGEEELMLIKVVQDSKDSETQLTGAGASATR